MDATLRGCNMHKEDSIGRTICGKANGKVREKLREDNSRNLICVLHKVTLYGKVTQRTMTITTNWDRQRFLLRILFITFYAGKLPTGDWKVVGDVVRGE